jgi:hypothetical protein
MAKICILTPAAGYEEDHRKEARWIDQLFGDAVQYRPWTDAGELKRFALILPLLAWGYQRDPARWYKALDSWEAQGLPFANPISLMRWNTDKGYLFDLEAAGIAIVPTRLATAFHAQDVEDARVAFGTTDIVIKPTISGGADGTYLLRGSGMLPSDVLDRQMLIQPLMGSIATEGEYSLFYFNAQFSHAILKRPATGDFRVQEQFGGAEEKIAPPFEARMLAESTLAMLYETPLYARVDMVRDGDDQFRVMELEVIEPSLFLAYADFGGAQFASALRNRVGKELF